jgi:hypothetical protein
MLMVLAVLAAPPFTQRAGHVLAEEAAPTIPPEPVNTSCGTGEGDGDIQILSIARANQELARPEPPAPPGARHAAGSAGLLGIRPREGPVKSLMVALVTWIAATSDHSVPDTLPDVVAMTQTDFDLYLCEQMEQCSSPTPHAEILAFFDLESRAIYIVEGFDPRDVEHQSTMVRELVHFLLAPAVRGRGCRGVFVHEAHQITNRWRAARGLPALPLTPVEMLSQSCVPGWTEDQRRGRALLMRAS